jgi:hypothetical protein
LLCFELAVLAMIGESAHNNKTKYTIITPTATNSKLLPTATTTNVTTTTVIDAYVLNDWPSTPGLDFMFR